MESGLDGFESKSACEFSFRAKEANDLVIAAAGRRTIRLSSASALILESKRTRDRGVSHPAQVSLLNGAHRGARP